MAGSCSTERKTRSYSGHHNTVCFPHRALFDGSDIVIVTFFTVTRSDAGRVMI